MSDYPLSLEDDLRTAPKSVRHHLPLRLQERVAAAVVVEDHSEHHFDWDSADLVVPGGLSPARQLAMQRQQERLAATPRKPEAVDR